ncbi:hypothetical protein PG996_009085 [Apiospora saccharicola]|uniref:Uncharacterized protein n=1 Tax=Apiospora saccharicola TaxID=335842 RepID=A0ABR1UJQ8_9PEZI
MRQRPAACLRSGRLSRQPPSSLRRPYSTSSGQGDEASKTPTLASRMERVEDKSTRRRGIPFHYRGIICQLSEANKQQARSSHTSAPGATRADAAAAKNTHHSDNATTASAPAPPQPTAKEEEAGTTTPLSVPVPGTVAPLPIWQRLGPLTRGAEAYARAQRRRPWVTQVATMLVIYLCADISAQQISGKDEHEYARTARSLTIGGVAAIPGHMWFVFLSQNFNYPSKVLSIAVKVAINQAFFTPIFNTYFFGGQALLSGDSLQQAWDRVCATVPVSVVNSCKIWPVVSAISFAYLPLEYRALFAGVVAVGWQTYLSFLNRQAEAAEARALATKAGSQMKKDVSDTEHRARVLSMAGPARNVAEIRGTDGTRIAA